MTGQALAAQAAARVAHFENAATLFASDIADSTNFAMTANGEGRPDLSISVLTPLAQKAPASPRVWQMLALSYRDAQQMEAALAAILEAQKRAPDDALINLAVAQIHFETGRPASAHFKAAQRYAPDDLAITNNAAAALQAEGNAKAGFSVLEKALDRHPDWLDGHKALATMRATTGAKGGSGEFARSYAVACAAMPNHLPLRMAWFHALSAARLWADALRVVAEGEAIFGPQRAFDIARAYVASESGLEAYDAGLFDPLADFDDPGLHIARVRHALRGGAVDLAEAIAAQHIGRASASAFWPYLSTCWRLLGDDRAVWLDGDPAYISAIDLGLSTRELNALAACLRRAHSLVAPFHEQSVRGGTQTDGVLFSRHEPEIGMIKTRIDDAVRGYIAALPATVAGHPLLEPPRQDVRYAGSWSVRLANAGFHVVHSHTRGWISSAFYVSLPQEMGAAPAGWLELGAPPPDLGLTLAPYHRIEPKVGRLALFPSTMWHGTVPFEAGERLTIAFDVAVPRF